MKKQTSREPYDFYDGEYPPKRAWGVLLRAPLMHLGLAGKIPDGVFSGDFAVRTQAVSEVLERYRTLWLVEGELDGAMVLDVINFCFAWRVQVPHWIQEEFLERHESFRTYRAKSFDDAFSLGNVDEREQKMFAERIRLVPALVLQMRKLAEHGALKSETAIRNSAADILGIRHSYARELYLEARNVWEVGPIVEGKRRKPTGAHDPASKDPAFRRDDSLSQALAAWHQPIQTEEMAVAASPRRKKRPRS